MTEKQKINPLQTFNALSLPASNEPYAAGSGSKARIEAREQFLTNEALDWPEIEYPLLNEVSLRDSEQILLRLLNEVIKDDELPEATKDITFEQIAGKLAETYRHLEVLRGLGKTAAKKELSRDRAGAMTLEIFGEPNSQIFRQLQAEDAQLARKALHSDDANLAKVAEEYLDLTYPAPTEADEVSMSQKSEQQSSFELSDKTMERIKSDLCVIFPKLPKFLEEKVDDDIEAKDSIPYFTRALEIMDLDKKGWYAESTQSGSAEAKSDRIEVGENRKPFTPVDIKGVPLHESGHGFRTQNAREQSDPAKRGTLFGNTAFEEGLMTGIEQIVTGERRVVGAKYYMSLGYQLGLDNHHEERRNFKQTHEIMWRRDLLTNQSPDSEVTADVIRKAKVDAYKMIMRTTRGNSLDARDISYFEGSRKANQWLNEIAQLPEEKRIEMLRWVFSGKFDPTNPLHADFFDEPR